MKPDATPQRGTEVAAEEVVALEWMKARIQDMSEQPPMWSRNTYTHRRTSHVAFANGAVRIEGEHPQERAGSVRDLVDMTIRAVRTYRDQIEGPAVLVWRQEPELRRDGGYPVVYCRLAFEPDLWA